MIIGGGPIGIEMAQAHVRLGVDVTVIEALSVMARDDSELVAMLKTQLEADGVTFIEGVSVTSVRQNQPNGITLTLANGAVIKASHLLVATGRRPVIDGLSLPAAGVKFGKTGIVTDRRLRTSNKRDLCHRRCHRPPAIYPYGQLSCQYLPAQYIVQIPRKN